jgi:hypothetical protein
MLFLPASLLVALKSLNLLAPYSFLRSGAAKIRTLFPFATNFIRVKTAKRQTSQSS